MLCSRLFPAVALPSALLALVSCAIPIAPTGGPADDTPPAIASSEPATQSVDVATTTLQITFTEYVDPASFVQALSIAPEFSRPPTYRWRRRSVTLSFPEPLAPNTTYIVTLDTKLRDINRVALKQPLTIAFATGPRINRGTLEGRIVDAATGGPLGGVDVFAYAAPDSLLPSSLPERPTYRTQTDPQGRFAFAYLSEQPYFVIGLRDQNRNFRVDGMEPYAVPPESLFVADTVGTPAEAPWLLTRRDTIPPEIQRVRALSNRRFALRFSESVLFTDTDPALWSVRDSTSGDTAGVEAAYLLPEDPRQVYLVTAPLPGTRHLVRAGGIADSSLNLVRSTELSFTPSTGADTFQVRFAGFAPAGGGTGPVTLPPNTDAAVRFSAPLPLAVLRNAVAIADSSGAPLAYVVATSDGVSYRLTPERPDTETAFTVRIGGAEVGLPDTVIARSFAPWPARERGALSGLALADSGASGVPVVDLVPYEPSSMPLSGVTPDPTGRFLFDGLPAASRYRFRAFLDRNGNRRWDGGVITPFDLAEPLVWSADSLTVRARWETELSDTLRIR
jgi:hypothetical protein